MATAQSCYQGFICTATENDIGTGIYPITPQRKRRVSSEGIVKSIMNRFRKTPPLTNNYSVKNWIRNVVKGNKVVVFSKGNCRYCKSVLSLLSTLMPRKQIMVVACDKINRSNELRSELWQLTKSKTVPQVFIRGRYIGGCDDTYRKYEHGELSRLLY